MKVSFSREEILKESNIRIKDSRLHLFFIFYFHFLNLELGFSVILHITVTKCHSYIS